MKVAIRHDISHNARQALWIFMVRNTVAMTKGLMANPKATSYRTLRRDVEETMPKVSMDLVRVGPDGMVEENDVSSITQNKDLRKYMETASCRV